MVCWFWPFSGDYAAKPTPPFCGAALFALHPIQVEAVRWVTGLNDLLCMFFALGASLLYISFSDSNSNKNQPNGKKWFLYYFALASFILALLSKPAAVVLPLMLLFVERIFIKKQWRESLRALLPWLVPAAAIIAITKIAEPEAQNIFSPLWARPLIALDALGFYLSKLLYPVWLGPDYGRTPKSILENSWAYLTWVAPVLLLSLAWFLRRKYDWFIGALLVFVCGLIPVLGFVPFRYQSHSTVADRYLYLPFLGIAILAAYALQSLKKGRIPKSALALTVGAILLLCAGLSMRQVRFWQNNATLFKHVRDVNPTSWVAHTNYGSFLLHTGRFNEAAQSFELAAKQQPDYFALYTDLAYAYARAGKNSQAEKAYRDAMRKRPGSAVALAGLGNVLGQSGKRKEAISHYRRALKLDPWLAEVWFNLGNALYQEGDYPKAVYAF